MATLVPLDFTQPNNKLTRAADAQRVVNQVKNDFIAKTDEYSSTSPDALADGDTYGRGTGIFLDVYNETAGTSIDVLERKFEIKINKYNKVNIYKVED